MTLRKIEQGLSDLSPMPFGRKYKNMLMQDVPTTYLHWFWHSVTPVGDDAAVIDSVREYIKKNLVALKQENEDLIWL